MDLYVSAHTMHSTDFTHYDQIVRAHVRLPLCLNLSSLGSSFFQQLGYALGGLCTLTQPVVGALLVNRQTNFCTTGNGVEKADTLDKTAITCVAAVGHSQVIERAFFRATTCKTDSYH